MTQVKTCDFGVLHVLSIMTHSIKLILPLEYTTYMYNHISAYELFFFFYEYYNRINYIIKKVIFLIEMIVTKIKTIDALLSQTSVFIK